MLTKLCSTCFQNIPISEFGRRRKNSNSPWVLKGVCDSCVRVRDKAYYAKRSAPKKRIRIDKRRRRVDMYGLTKSKFEQILEEQAFECKICHCLLDTPCVDHDHRTGKVRGLLCRTCNTGLGMFEDDIEILLNAVEYLRNSKEL